MKKTVSLVICALCAFVSTAQTPVTVPVSAPAQEPITADSAPADSVVSFAKGSGAAIDTLDVKDPRVLVVLRDDNTWCYIRNLANIASDTLFTGHWNTTSVNAYADVAYNSLPYHSTIILDDGVGHFTCPYRTKVFSKFGYRHGRRHQGVDLPLKTGEPVRAAFDGKVRISMACRGYGQLIVIRHDNGLETYYGHLSKRMVESGDWVHSGDVIGLGGSTGRSTGPHLHFETRYQGYAFDPQWIADFEQGTLRRNVFVLRRSYLDASSHYVPESIDEEEAIYLDEEKIVAEEKRIAAEKAAMRWHKVRSGETVSGIAKRYGITQTKIKQLNPKLNINRISIGQKIRIN